MLILGFLGHGHIFLNKKKHVPVQLYPGRATPPAARPPSARPPALSYLHCISIGGAGSLFAELYRKQLATSALT